MHRFALPLSASLLLSLAVPAMAAPPPAERSTATIRIELRQGKSLRVEAIGFSAVQRTRLKSLSQGKWATVFPVRVAARSGITAAKLPAIIGRWTVESDRVIFVPRFEFEPGLTYTALFDLRQAFGTKASAAVTHRFTIPKGKPARPPVVTHVYPSGPVLPENLLKFYVHFSVPMSRGEAYRRITLHEAGGKQVPRPFLELEQELWDRTGTRFTLFFEPGRIKRGLRPREEFGPALQEGKSYVLRIDSRWSTESGHQLTKTFEAKFRVGPPDSTQPDPEKWKLAAPTANGRTPLTVLLDEALDHAMLQRVLSVRTSTGKRIAGTVSIDRNERRWRFTPDAAWKSGGYVLRVDTRLEDRSGNSVGRAFETPESRSNKPPKTPEYVELKFQVRP